MAMKSDTMRCDILGMAVGGVTPALFEAFGPPIVVENKTGANGNLALHGEIFNAAGIQPE